MDKSELGAFCSRGSAHPDKFTVCSASEFGYELVLNVAGMHLLFIILTFLPLVYACFGIP